MAGRRKGATRIGGAARAALSLPERLRRSLVPVAFCAGWIGVAALLACGVIALVPDAARPQIVQGDRLPLAAVLSLCVAALLGWGYVQDGQTHVRQRIGRPAAIVAFVVLPLLAAAVSFVSAHDVGTAPVAEWPGGRWIALVARWYMPALIAVSIATFLARTTRPKKRIYLRRGVWFVVLVSPYAVLLAVLLLDLGTPWLEEPIEDAVGTIGRSSIAAQLIVGYFLGDRSGD